MSDPCTKNSFGILLVCLTCALASSESTWCMTESISRWSIIVSVKWSGTNSPILLSHLTRATETLGSLQQKLYKSYVLFWRNIVIATWSLKRWQHPPPRHHWTLQSLCAWPPTWLVLSLSASWSKSVSLIFPPVFHEHLPHLAGCPAWEEKVSLTIISLHKEIHFILQWVRERGRCCFTNITLTFPIHFQDIWCSVIFYCEQTLRIVTAKYWFKPGAEILW